MTESAQLQLTIWTLAFNSYPANDYYSCTS